MITDVDAGRTPSADATQQFRGFPARAAVDPRTLTSDELLRLGLPPRPTRPALRRAWDKALGSRLDLLRFEAEASLAAEDAAPSFRQTDRSASLTTRFETSRNWSGASIAATSGLSVVQIWASWTLPSLTAPPDPGIGPPALSMWVGIDGQRRYFDSSLPQIGTTAKIGGAGPPLEAWVQWWSRESATTLPITIANFPLSPGDEVCAAVTVLDPLSVLFLLVNVTAAVGVAILGVSPAVERGDGTLVEQPRITGATAEWILERPRDTTGTRDLLAFPDYTPTAFTECQAVVANHVGLAGVLAGHERDLLDARLIRMYDRLHQPERTALISMASLDGTDTVRLHHGGFTG